VNGARCARLLKFSAVGAMGIVVQFSVLAALTALRLNYLMATAFAVEFAVIHNFFWHRRYTWRDRMDLGWSSLVLALFRFHVSNGFVSILGNLILMRLFVGALDLPLLIANGASISICFLANFIASDRWVFPA
jgi:putative flippase GtrA